MRLYRQRTGPGVLKRTMWCLPKTQSPFFWFLSKSNFCIWSNAATAAVVAIFITQPPSPSFSSSPFSVCYSLGLNSKSRLVNFTHPSKSEKPKNICLFLIGPCVCCFKVNRKGEKKKKWQRSREGTSMRTRKKSEKKNNLNDKSRIKIMLRWNYESSHHRHRSRLYSSLQPYSSGSCPHIVVRSFIRSFVRSFIKVNYIEWDISGFQLRVHDNLS